MKILYIHDSPLNLSSANSNQLISMCNAFVQTGHTVTLCLPFEENLEMTITSLGLHQTINIECLYDKKLYRFINYFLKISLKGVNESNYDIIFTRSPSVFSRLHFLKGKKYIYEAHNYLIHHKSKILNRFWISRFKNWSRLDNVSIITISESLKKYYVDLGFNALNIQTEHDAQDVQNKVKDVSFDMIFDEKKIEHFQKFNKVCTYAGSLGTDRGLEVLENITKQLHDTLFLICGGNDSEMNYWKKFLNTSNVYFTGRLNQTELYTILNYSDVLIGLWSSKIPTINYCSPLKLFEYLYFEKPIVLPRFKTFLEVLPESEAYYFIPDDIPSFELALSNSINLGVSSDQKLKILELAKYYTWNNRVQRIISST